jgi:hypothetical protein
MPSDDTLTGFRSVAFNFSSSKPKTAVHGCPAFLLFLAIHLQGM